MSLPGGPAFIVAARRSAIGRVGGMHRARSLEALSAPVIRAVLAEAGISPEAVDELILGNAAGGGGNPARRAGLAAGLPHGLSAFSIDRQCASGLDAILAGARLIETGAARIVIAGGAESPSTAPWRVARPDSLHRGLPRFYDAAPFAPSGSEDPSMIEAAEAVARDFRVSRADQDAYARLSHERAAAARATGRFEAEIVPIGDDRLDEGVRPGVSAALLARMRPLMPDGSVTAGNSCAISDGAAFVVMCSEAAWRGLGRPPALRVLGGAGAGVAPSHPGMGPVPAMRRLLARSDKIAPADIGAVEFNEAFASQTVACLRELALDEARVNAAGGAIAFGHPYGASGAVLAVRLFSRMIREGGAHLGAAMLGAAGGQGVAALFEAVDMR